MFTSLSDKVGSVWVPVSVSVRTCVSAHLVSFSALSDVFLVITPVYTVCVSVILSRSFVWDCLCITWCDHVYPAHALLCLPSHVSEQSQETPEQADPANSLASPLPPHPDPPHPAGSVSLLFESSI